MIANLIGLNALVKHTVFNLFQLGRFSLFGWNWYGNHMKSARLVVIDCAEESLNGIFAIRITYDAKLSARLVLFPDT